MKYYFILSTLIIITLLSACSEENPCEGVCENNGTSFADGQHCMCICPQGFEGSSCEMLSREKLLGSWPAREECMASGIARYNVSFTEGDFFNEVRISNFWDYFDNTVVAIVDSADIYIPLQNPDDDSLFIEGYGIYSYGGRTITFNFQVTDQTSMPAIENTCTAILGN